MSGLRDYLGHKRAAILARRERIANGEGPDAPIRLAAHVDAAGRSGVRRIKIRDFTLLMDTPEDFAGFNFGPGSPELQIGVLGSCLTHIFLIQAADRQVSLDRLEVDVTADIDYRAGQPGHEQTPVFPHNITYTVHIESPASAEQIDELHKAVERVCPVLNLLVNPQQITGNIVLNDATAVAAG